MFASTKKTILCKRVATAFILTLLVFTGFVGSFLLEAKTAEAEQNWQDYYGDYLKTCAYAALIDLAVSFVASQRVPVDDWPAWIKEHVWDCGVWAFKASLIEDMTGQTVAYVQEGYDGNPAFVTNVNAYLKQTADEVAGLYIEGTVPFLCSPFQADIQLALTDYYRQQAGIGYNERASCTLSGTVENINDFVNGDFSSGGWDEWFEFVGDPYNNPLGSYVESVNELSLRVSSEKGQSVKKIDLGGGFFPKEHQTCYAFLADGQQGAPQPFTVNAGETVQQAMARQNITAPGGIECDPKNSVTPGGIIKSGLEQTFGTNLDNVVSADELNEVIKVYLAYLLNDVISGDNGLAGYNKEQFGYSGHETSPSGNPDDPDSPVIQTDCGSGTWFSSDATESGNTLTFNKSGLVLDAAPGNANIAFGIPTESGLIYTKATVSVDVEIGPWFEGAPNDYHQIMYLQRGSSNPNNFDWAENNIGLINVRGPGQGGNKLIAGNNLNLTIGDCTKAKNTSFTPQPGERYNFTYTYDTNNEIVRTVVRKDGEIVATLGDTQTADMIQSNHPDKPNRSGFFVWLGGPETYQAPEVPMFGWKFYDLSVTIEYEEPQDTQPPQNVEP